MDFLKNWDMVALQCCVSFCCAMKWIGHSIQFSSVTQLCLTLCDPRDSSTSGFPAHHQLLELAQTHVRQVSDAIQPSHPLSSPSPPTFSLFQNQGLFQWISSSHQVAKNISFSISSSNEYSRLISFRIDWLDLLAVLRSLKSLLERLEKTWETWWDSWENLENQP